MTLGKYRCEKVLNKCEKVFNREITMSYHIIPIGMAIAKKTKNNNTGADVEKRENFCAVGGNINWFSHFGKQYGSY